MVSDSSRRIGRGGAGNFVPTASAAQNTDPIASPSLPPAPPQPPAAGTFAKTGRGGAGNFQDPDDAVRALESQEHAQAELAVVAAAAAAIARQPRPATYSSGRGGAGNWKAAAEPQDEHGLLEEDQARSEAVDSQVVAEVDAGLSMPPRTYHQDRK